MDHFEIKSDKSKNRLYIILEGFFLESEVELALDKLNYEMKNLKFGFDTIIDITHMKTKPEFVKNLFFDQIIQRTKSEAKFIFNISSKNIIVESFRSSKRISNETNTRIRYFHSVEEAENFLERNSLLKNIYSN